MTTQPPSLAEALASLRATTAAEQGESRLLALVMALLARLFARLETLALAWQAGQLALPIRSPGESPHTPRATTPENRAPRTPANTLVGERSALPRKASQGAQFSTLVLSARKKAATKARRHQQDTKASRLGLLLWAFVSSGPLAFLLPHAEPHASRRCKIAPEALPSNHA